MNFLLTIIFSLSLSTGLTISNSEENIRAELISSPPPQYPVHVRVDGWVLLKYDISEDGLPVNIIILDAEPKHLFGRSAKRALSGGVINQLYKMVTHRFNWIMKLQ